MRISIILIALAPALTSCVKYSFSGGDTPCANSIIIKTFFNDAGGGPANMAQSFSEKLRDYYQQNTKLAIVKDKADWQLEGRIIGYTVAPVAPQGAGTAALNRLTITVAVTFQNNKFDESNKGLCPPQSFETPFSFYDDFPQTQSLTQAEPQLVPKILDKIVFDIYTRTTSNW